MEINTIRPFIGKTLDELQILNKAAEGSNYSEPLIQAEPRRFTGNAKYQRVDK